MAASRAKGYIPRRRNDRNSVGKTIERIRKAKHLTQVELAARAQVRSWEITHSAIKRIESGEREVTDIELRKLAKALRVPVAVLFE